jgi:hypothetical protein
MGETLLSETYLRDPVFWHGFAEPEFKFKTPGQALADIFKKQQESASRGL